jgi:hypothetical protein
MKHAMSISLCLVFVIVVSGFLTTDAKAVTEQNVTVAREFEPNADSMDETCSPSQWEFCDLSYLIDDDLGGPYYQIQATRRVSEFPYNSFKATGTVELNFANNVKVAPIQAKAQVIISASSTQEYGYEVWVITRKGYEKSIDKKVLNCDLPNQTICDQPVYIDITQSKLDSEIGNEPRDIQRIRLEIWAKGTSQNAGDVTITLKFFEIQMEDTENPTIGNPVVYVDGKFTHVDVYVQDGVSGIAQVSVNCNFLTNTRRQFDVNVPAYPRGTTEPVLIRSYNTVGGTSGAYRCGISALDVAGKYTWRVVIAQAATAARIEGVPINLLASLPPPR